MSVKAMGAVWDCPDLNPTQKLVLLSLADHCDHEGRNAYPSIGLLARKTGFDPRTVQRTLKALEARGLLSREYATESRRTNTFTINLMALGGGGTVPPYPGTVPPLPPAQRHPTPAQRHPTPGTVPPDPLLTVINREGDPNPTTPKKPLTRRKTPPKVTPLYAKGQKP